MKSDDTIHAAEERLLDAALTQFLAAPRDTAAPRRNVRMLVVAALVVLGSGVVAATAWFAASPPRDEAQEHEPAPMPDEVPGNGAAEIEALPVTTENLFAKLTDPRDLPVVGRFEGLRRLRLWPEKTRILGISTGGYRGEWSAPPADLLQPLAKLTRLEVLGLPHEFSVTPEVLAPLAGHPALREIQLVRDQFTIDGRFAAALTRIPHLRALHLRFVPVGGATMHHVATLPLTSLDLEYCSGLDAAAWNELLTMRTLERLSFLGWDWSTTGGTLTWRPTAEELQRLCELPRLRHLALLHCAIDDAQLAALPDTLTTLRISGTKLTTEGFGALQRFVALRELDIETTQRGSTIAYLFEPDSEVAAEAFAAALPSLRLQKLRFFGALSPSVAEAIGSQPDLRDLHISSKQPAETAAATLFARLPVQRVSWRAPVTGELLEALAKRPELRELELSANDITDVAALATAPRLERLTLIEEGIDNGIAASVLAPLAGSTTLREIIVRVSVVRGKARASEGDLQRAVGDRIRVRLRETEMTVKR